MTRDRLLLCLALVGCSAPTTEPRAQGSGPGCWLRADAGDGTTVNAHYATCPAPAGSTSWDLVGAQGQTSHFRVDWD